jgi:hypothetical protein
MVRCKNRNCKKRRAAHRLLLNSSELIDRIRKILALQPESLGATVLRCDKPAPASAMRTS